MAFKILDSFNPELKELDETNKPEWGIAFKIFMRQEDLTKWLLDNDLKTIRNSDTGEISYCVHGVLATLETTEEKINALLDMRNRGLTDGGININDKTWQKLPKKRFKDL